MGNSRDCREGARFSHEASILIENIPDGTYYHGKMVNYSENGMCFESHAVHEPGNPIIFSIEDSPYPECPGVYHGQIKWCQQLPETASLYNFGMGVEYFKPDFLLALHDKSLPGATHNASPFTDGDGCRYRDRQTKTGVIQENDVRQNGQKSDKEHRVHQRRSFDRPILYATGNRFFKGTIKDISKGGVFIEAPDMIAVGQRLTLAIPSGHQGRGLKLKGEIVRIDPSGLAIRFERVIKN